MYRDNSKNISLGVVKLRVVEGAWLFVTDVFSPALEIGRSLPWFRDLVGKEEESGELLTLRVLLLILMGGGTGGDTEVPVKSGH